MSTTTRKRPSSFNASSRFFAIGELLDLFLDQCTINVLLNCSLVCRSWNLVISNSSYLQQQLFLKPEKDTGAAEYRINPILWTHFAPILYADMPRRDEPEGLVERLEFGSNCSRSDLTLLPWARNTSMFAPTRCAFVQREASWRNMLVSQPPIRRIDWWHEWLHDRSVAEKAGSWIARRMFNRDGTAANGWGHQDQSREYITLGMLYDLVESRLARGCLVRVQYFLRGKAVEDDPFATSNEQMLMTQGDRSRRPYTDTIPRVKITTLQVWNKKPWSEAGFDMEEQQWVTMPKRRPAYYAGDGFNVLAADCYYDRSNGGCRFSKSDGFRWTGLDGEGSGHYRRD